MLSATATTTLEILTSPLTGPELVRDYLAGAPGAAPFYAAYPFDPEAYRRKAAAVTRRLPAAQRALLAPALRPLSAGAAARLDRILAGDGYVVTTGQQAGLFGGPLYTVNKALSALRLAEALEALLEKPVLAVFWIAADDHDWAEVNHTWVLDRNGAALRIDVSADPAAVPHAMADRPLGDGIRAALEALERALPETDFSPALLDAVRSAYRPDTTVAGAFEALLAELFEGHDLALLNSAHPALRQAASPLVRRALENSARDSALIAGATERLAAAGYPAQVQVADAASNVFLHDEHGRDRLVRESGAWETRRTRRRLEDDALAALLQEQPERFSPNVFLRPVVESALLPTLAYVGGPAEISYFAQIGCLFEAHGVEPPIAFPRFRITLVEGRVRRVLEKFGLDVDAFTRPLHELIAELVRREVPEEVTRAVSGMRAAVAEGYAALTHGAAAVDPTLEAWMLKQRNAALINLNDAERKVASHLRRRMNIEIGQLERAAASIAPAGTPQERALSVIPYLARYGPELLRDMKASLRVELTGSPGAAWAGVRCEG
jgi:bacillithiol biosynthesis cysteine-adding enzyme BshC